MIIDFRSIESLELMVTGCCAVMPSLCNSLDSSCKQLHLYVEHLNMHLHILCEITLKQTDTTSTYKLSWFHSVSLQKVHTEIPASPSLHLKYTLPVQTQNSSVLWCRLGKYTNCKLESGAQIDYVTQQITLQGSVTVTNIKNTNVKIKLLGEKRELFKF